MGDAGRWVRNITIGGFVLVLLVCLGAGLYHRDAILGGFALRGAQTRFEERVRGVVGPGVRIEYRDESERAAMLVVSVPAATYDDPDARAEAAGSVWTAYAEEFAGGGMPVATVTLVRDASAAVDAESRFPVGGLIEETGVGAPPLHPMYAEKGYFDASQEAVPGDAGTGD